MCVCVCLCMGVSGEKNCGGVGGRRWEKSVCVSVVVTADNFFEQI